MSTTKLSAASSTKPVILSSSTRRIRKISRTESEGSGEEGGRLDPGEGEAVSYCEVHDVPPPPDGGYGWVVVFASFMCNMIVDGIAYTFGIFMDEFASYYNEEKGKTAWVGSLLAGMYLLAGPVVSALTNKFGCRAVCMAGSVLGCVAFVLSIFSPNINVLMLTYGVIGGIGFGLIYLPAVVCVGYYFETKRSLATGIAVCGSGVGTFLFAPLATFLLEEYGWKGANLILSGLILNCAVFGALMRPLEFPKENDSCKPLLQRMADEKRFQMERGSIGGSYFIVQLQDGSMEKRMKMPINIDPGVHSSFCLNELGTPLTPVPTMPVLPTITEAKAPSDQASSSQASSSSTSNSDLKKGDKSPTEKTDKKVELPTAATRANLPRNKSQPAFSTQNGGLTKNVSVPFFDRIRKTSQGERFKPTLQAIKTASRGNMNSNGDVRKSMRLSQASFTGSKNNNMDDMWSKTDMECESVCFTSKASLKVRKELVRPLSRKDIFYSGSIVHLPEYQSTRSLTNYRQSVISLSAGRGYQRGPDGEIIERPELCPCCKIPDSIKSALTAMLDWTLLKDPVFLMIGISNVFGMAGLYVPFVFLVNAAEVDGIESTKASFLISLIGITNTFGRVACGFLADLPWVNSLFLNNISLVICTFAVGLTPFCHSYESYFAAAIFFALAISAYISLTSIILVDLLGLDKLTNAFGLLILFRGVAAILGTPLAGALYDATKTYSIPFYVAGGLFLLSTITSFLAPVLRRCSPNGQGDIEMHGDDDALTPIDEDDEELDEDDEESGAMDTSGGVGLGLQIDNNQPYCAPQTQSNPPQIVETAASPVSPQQVPIEIKQIESVL